MRISITMTMALMGKKTHVLGQWNMKQEFDVAELAWWNKTMHSDALRKPNEKLHHEKQTCVQSFNDNDANC